MRRAAPDEMLRVIRPVRGDLDRIVMKAPAKERDRRYDSAIGLANDVGRYLNHEPVTAGPPTAVYRMMLLECTEVPKKMMGTDHPDDITVVARVGRDFPRQRRWLEAETTCREALAIRERKEPDPWTTFNAKSLLGRKRLEEAEPPLRTGCEGMKQRLAKIPPRAKKYALEPLDGLIAFGEATGKLDEVEAWKLEWAKLTAEATTSH